MRIDGWSIAAFGPIVDWDETSLAHHDVVVVLGPNESGKSALFEFFASALFGFSPATAEAHPYRPWATRSLGGRLDGQLNVVLSSGGQARIERWLTSRPDGHIKLGEGLERLANRQVPWVGLMTRDVFKNVYALTQEESLGLDQRAWQQVQDRVLGGSSFDFLRPSRSVVSALDAERTRLWRSDRRGRPESRAIEAEIRQLRREDLSEALDRRPQIERADARLTEIESELADNTCELQSVVLALDRNSKLAPLVRRVERVRDLQAQAAHQAPDSDRLAEAPGRRAVLASKIRDLQQECEDLQRELDDRLEELKLSESTRRLLAARNAIERLNDERLLAQEDLNRIERMERALVRYDGSLIEIADRTLTVTHFDEASRNAIHTLSVAELRERFDDWRRAQQASVEAAQAIHEIRVETVRLEDTLRASEPVRAVADLDERLRELRRIEALRLASFERPSPRLSLAPPLLAAIGLAGLAALVLGIVVAGLLGAVLVVVGAGALAFAAVAFWSRLFSASETDWEASLHGLGLSPDVNLAAEISETQADRDAVLRREGDTERLARLRETESEAGERAYSLAEAAETAREGFLAVIAHVPVAPVHRESPRDGLVSDLLTMRQTIGDAMDIRRDRDAVSARLDAWRDAAVRLCQDLEQDLTTDPFAAVPAANRQLSDALDVKRAADRAALMVPELREKLDGSRRALDEAQVGLEQIDAELIEVDPGRADPTIGLSRLERALELREEARSALAEIERETPEWNVRVTEALELRAAGDTIGLSDDERVSYELRADTLRAIREDLANERGRLEAQRDDLMRQPGPAHIEGAIEAADERLRDVKREHDRLALLRQVVLTAERSYRERYQSPLLTVAGAHLRRFTGGRYDLLTVDDAASGDVKLQVRRTGEDFPQDVDTPLSRGTIQQIYFALRLAMVDLVEGDESLPLFLDEMFVNWDPGRTTSGLAALADMPGDRQVFLFTADPFWAERAVQDVPAHIVRTPAG